MRFTVEQSAWSASFSPDSRRVLIGVGGSAAAVRYEESFEKLRANAIPIADFAPVRVCDISSGQEVLRTGLYAFCRSTAYSPDGKSIAVASLDNPIEIRDAGTGELVRSLGLMDIGRIPILRRPDRNPPAEWAVNVLFSPDSRLLASSHLGGPLRVWDIARDEVLHTFPAVSNAVRSAAFTPDGKHLLVIDRDATLRLYEVGGGKEVRKFEGHTERVTDVAVSADGQRALSCSLDKTIRLWDLETGKELRRLAGHDEVITCVAFCPDGRRALSGSGNRTLRLWDLTTGRQLHRFDGHEGIVFCVAVSPDGRYALSGGEDRTVRLWRLPDAAPAPETP
jgi:WD40 repeat protein